jgi:hypothetical protein
MQIAGELEWVPVPHPDWQLDTVGTAMRSDPAGKASPPELVSLVACICRFQPLQVVLEAVYEPSVV